MQGEDTADPGFADNRQSSSTALSYFWRWINPDRAANLGSDNTRTAVERFENPRQVCAANAAAAVLNVDVNFFLVPAELPSWAESLM
jgi:hypothetical protein